MPNKSEINQELVRAFNSILRFSNAVVTNFTLESAKRDFSSSKEDYIVISFDKNMTIDQRKKYLSSMREKVIKRFCPDKTILDGIFYTKFFPFNFDQGESAEDNKFLVPIRKEVVSNLKFLLANELARFATSNIVEQKKEDKKLELGCEDLSDDIEEEIENHVDYNIIDEVFYKGSYLYGAECVDKNLQRSFVDLLSSRITGYENGPKKTKDFLEEKGNYVYLKKSIFDNPKLIKDIAKHELSLQCRDLQVSSTEDEMNDTLKFAVVDLIRKALPHLPIRDIWHTSHVESEDEYSILAPVIDRCEYMGFLNEREVDHINNKVFCGTEVLCDFKDFIARKGLPTYSQRKIYAIDFANIDISYCVMDKITESSVINKDYKMSIDPARVPAMKPQTLAPSEIEGKGASGDSGLGNSPKKASTSFNRFSMKRKSPKREQSDASIGGHGVQHGIKRTLLTASKRKELSQYLKPELQGKLDSCSFSLEQEKMLYLFYVDKRELRLLLSSSSPETVKQEFPSLSPEHIEQILSDGLSLEKKENLLFKYYGFDREIDSGISSASSSGLCSSPTYPRSEVEECNTTQKCKIANQAVNRPFVSVQQSGKIR